MCKNSTAQGKCRFTMCALFNTCRDLSQFVDCKVGIFTTLQHEGSQSSGKPGIDGREDFFIGQTIPVHLRIITSNTTVEAVTDAVVAELYQTPQIDTAAK